MRKLAHIEQIVSLSPIEKADKIEVARILGWECVVKKDEFKVGDKVIYIETDSILPQKEEFKFLESVHYRIKPRKFRGQLSQGLVIPIKDSMKKYPIGKDVTTELGIVKYDPPEVQDSINVTMHGENDPKWIKKLMKYAWFRKLRRIISGEGNYGNRRPKWVPKTDEERIQNMPNVLDRFSNTKVVVTEKLDGTSASYTLVKGLFRSKLIVTSRNRTVVNKNSVYWKIAEKYNIKEVLKSFPSKSVIQGEIIGPRIQSNKYGLKEIDFYIHEIIVGNNFISYDLMSSYVRNKIKVVPIISSNIPLSVVGKNVDEVLESSKGTSVLNNIPREGIVVRTYNSTIKVISFKAINPDFIVKYNV